MDQDTANNLFSEGAIFILLDVPLHTEFGIDYNSWRTGPNFKGVKMIPPGIHFIYFSASDKNGNLGIRNGFFHNFKHKEVFIKKWSSQKESVDFDYEFTSIELEIFESNKKELDRFLGAYPYEEYKRWVSLTNNLNMTFLEKLIPEKKIICSGSILIGEEFKSNKNDDKGANKEKLFQEPASLSEAEKLLPKMTHEPGTNIRFTEIPSDYIPADLKPQELTKYSIDTSYKFQKLLENQKITSGLSDTNDFTILCELQFAFICFLIGQVYDAFHQWKTITSLLCNCDTAIKKHLGVFTEFINVLYFQLKEMPEDFFIDIIAKDNFLTVNLHNLFDNINGLKNECTDSDDLKQIQILQDKTRKFKNYLTQRFNIDFEEEPDEYAPTVCEI